MTAVLPKEERAGAGVEARVAPARNGAEALIQLMVARGVEYIFLNPGTDTAPLQEAVVGLRADGRRVPEIVPCLYENVALAGDRLLAGHPASAGGGGARRRGHPEPGRQPAQRPARAGRGGDPGRRAPYTDEGQVLGGRDISIQWQQDRPDQIGIVRNYVKWAYELAQTDTLCQLVPRPFQLAALRAARAGLHDRRPRGADGADGGGLAGAGRAQKPLITPAVTPRRSGRSRAGWSRSWRSPQARPTPPSRGRRRTGGAGRAAGPACGRHAAR